MENLEPIQDKDKGDLMFYIFLILAILLGAMLGSALAVLLGTLSGVQLGQILGDLGEDVSLGIRNYVRAANGVSHLFTFTIPAIAFALYFFGKKYWSALGFKSSINGKNLLLAIAFIVCSFPFVQLLYWLNRQLPLPVSFTNMEASAEQMLNAILTMEGPLELLLNLLVVAMLPAVGEELIFRGLLQQRLTRYFKNGATAIWIAAIIFSAIHLQFEGFLPRLFLGAALGYLFYWTKNLWVPIITHFVFNGMQVVVQYFFPEKMAELELAESLDPNWLQALLSLILFIGIGFYLKKFNSRQQSGV